METVRTETEIDADIFEFVPRFCESRKKDLQNIANFLLVDDFANIAKIGHVIKGVSRPYGFPTLEKMGVDLEKAALASDKAQCIVLQKQMSDYLKNYIQL